MAKCWSWRFLAPVLLLLGLARSSRVSENLCHLPGCMCAESLESPGLTDVACKCQGSVHLVIAPPTNSSSERTMPPDVTASLSLVDCQKVEIEAQTLNLLPMLTNLTVHNTESLTLRSRMYDARRGTGISKMMKVIEFSNIYDLEVERQALEGLSVSSFEIRDVYMRKVSSLAFSLDHVGEFAILSSRMDRISMRGFKMDSCDSFSVLGNSRFYSVASQAFLLRCSKFMLAYNVFVSLQDSSFDVTFGTLADIQGNTFESLNGKPFIKLRPAVEGDQEAGETGLGFVFRENKFAADPTLSFGALALPAFDLLMENSDSFIDVDLNHFLCDCDRIAWFIAAITHGFDTDLIEAMGGGEQGAGSLMFLERLYDTSGSCLKCSLRVCEADQSRPFLAFAESALQVRENELRCTKSGHPLRSQHEDHYGQRPNNELRTGDGGEKGGNSLPPSSYSYEKAGERWGTSTERPRPAAGTVDKEEAETRDVKDITFNGAKSLVMSFSCCTILLARLL